MTLQPRRKMPANNEIRRVFNLAVQLLAEHGVKPGTVDIRFDGVTVHPLAPAAPAPGTAFDRFLENDQARQPAKDQGSDRPAPR